jgi:hypothetical protein
MQFKPPCSALHSALLEQMLLSGPETVKRTVPLRISSTIAEYRSYSAYTLFMSSWVRTDLSIYMIVVEMHTWCSDWKRVIMIIIIVIIIIILITIILCS